MVAFCQAEGQGVLPSRLVFICPSVLKLLKLSSKRVFLKGWMAAVSGNVCDVVCGTVINYSIMQIAHA
jgi:hypothetical protein